MRAVIWVGIFLVLCSFVSAVSINEIMYDPAGSDINREWIEIYNNGSTIDLNGWKFYEGGINHGLSLKQGSWILENNTYAVIANNDVNFSLDYPSFSGTLFDSSFSLSNSGENISIKDNNGTFIDSISYLTLANEGYSLEFYNGSWRESTNLGGTPGSENSHPNETIIIIKECDWKIEILLDKYTFEDGYDVNWTVKVSKNYGEKANVTVRGYVRDMLGDWQRDYSPWTNEQITNYRNQKYTPNLWEDKFYWIFYNITGLNCDETYSSNNFDNKFIIVLSKINTNFTNIEINELLPNPEGSDNAAMPNGEFVELYNSGSEDVFLEGLGLKDDYGQDIDIFISNSNTLNGTVIKANDYLVVYMNGRSGFLNNNGYEKIGLYTGDDLIDEVSYSGSEENMSWSKIEGKWEHAISTPGKENFEEIEEEEGNETIEVVEAKVSESVKSISSESNLKESITGNVIFEDKGSKQKRSALYFFCALMLLIVVYYAYGRE